MNVMNEELAILSRILDHAGVEIYDTDGVPENRKEVLAVITHPSGWTWYIYEASRAECEFVVDWQCFGRVVGLESELGYFFASDVLDTGGTVYTADEAMLFGIEPPL